MAKISIVLLFVCLGLVHQGSALKCYACSSARNAECDEIDTSTTKVALNECQAPQNDKEVACVKYTIEDKAHGKMNTTRMCMTVAKDQDACAKVKSTNQNINIDMCESCKEDGCNSASNIQASVAAILFVFVAFFMGNRA